MMYANLAITECVKNSVAMLVCVHMTDPMVATIFGHALSVSDALYIAIPAEMNHVDSLAVAIAIRTVA